MIKFLKPISSLNVSLQIRFHSLLTAFCRYGHLQTQRLSLYHESNVIVLHFGVFLDHSSQSTVLPFWNLNIPTQLTRQPPYDATKPVDYLMRQNKDVFSTIFDDFQNIHDFSFVVVVVVERRC